MPKSLAAITGASSGIGEVFARKLAARGYDLLLIARRRERLDSLGSGLAQTHAIHAESLEADLTTQEGMERVAAERLEKEIAEGDPAAEAATVEPDADPES